MVLAKMGIKKAQKRIIISATKKYPGAGNFSRTICRRASVGGGAALVSLVTVRMLTSEGNMVA